MTKYISSFIDNGIELKVFLNEELGRLKKVVTESMTMEEVKNDEEMSEKTKKVLEIIDDFNDFYDLFVIHYLLFNDVI